METEHDRDQALERELQGLKREYDRLREEQVRTEQNLSNIEEQLARLRERAVERWGTAEPEKLEALLAEKRAENEKLVEEYRNHINGIQAALKAVEDQ